MADTLTTLRGITFSGAAIQNGAAVARDLPSLLGTAQRKCEELIAEMRALELGVGPTDANMSTITTLMNQLMGIGIMNFADQVQSDLIPLAVWP